MDIPRDPNRWPFLRRSSAVRNQMHSFVFPSLEPHEAMAETESSSGGSSSSSTPDSPMEAEWTVASILSLTDPATVCGVASVSRTFRAAAASDVVWARMLPPVPLSILLHSCDDRDPHQPHEPPLKAHLLSHSLPRKDLFRRLCRSIPLHGNTQRFWLDPSTGGECHMLSATELNIVWGSSPQYWEWTPCAGSWFPRVAHLRSVCWFLVEGTWRPTLSPGSYALSFRMRLHHSTGWSEVPVQLSLQNAASNADTVDSARCFTGPFPRSDSPPFAANLPDEDAWAECDLGEFHVGEGQEHVPPEIRFSMRETELLNWKGGLYLDGVIIRPSSVHRTLRGRQVLEDVSPPTSSWGEYSDDGYSDC